MSQRRYLSDLGKMEFADEGQAADSECARSQSQVTARNRDGQWVPSIPLPLYGLRKHCQCGRKFWTAEGYEGHYALTHILKMP